MTRTPHPNDRPSLLRWGATLALALLVATSPFALAETKATSKTVCVASTPGGQPIPVPVACAQGIVTTTEPLCGTNPSTGVYSCTVTIVWTLTVSGPATCGKLVTDQGFELEICTLALPGRSATPPTDRSYSDIPPGGRSETIEGQVCVRLSFEDEADYRCEPFKHTFFLPAPASVSAENLLLAANTFANYATTYAEPDPEPVVIVLPEEG